MTEERAAAEAVPSWRSQALVGLAVVAAAVAVLAAFAALASVVDRPFRFFSKEPAETMGGPRYVGTLAHVVVLVWATGAVTAVFTGASLLRSPVRGDARFLVAAGSFTALLLLDDFFLLHETIYPAVGIPEELLYLAYGALVVAGAWRFRRVVAGHDVLLAAAALGAWGASVLADFVQEHRGAHLHVIEDGAKLVGAALWAGFLVRASARVLGWPWRARAEGEPGPTPPDRPAGRRRAR